VGHRVGEGLSAKSAHANDLIEWHSGEGVRVGQVCEGWLSADKCVGVQVRAFSISCAAGPRCAELFARRLI
jgi:hypothetical protein